MTIRVLPPDPLGMLDRLRRHQLDFIFTIESALLPDHPGALVLDEPFLCIAWKSNPRVHEELTLPLFLELGHAVARYGDIQISADRKALDDMGIQRREEVICATPVMLGPLVVGTERIATVTARIARGQAKILPLKLFEPPVRFPPLRVIMQWHRQREQDGATIWMRDLDLEIARNAGLVAAKP